MRLQTQVINFIKLLLNPWTFSFNFSEAGWPCEWLPPAKWRTQPSSPSHRPRSTWTLPCRGPGSWSRRTWCPCTPRPGAAACPRPGRSRRWQNNGRRPTRAILCAAEEIRVECHFYLNSEMSVCRFNLMKYTVFIHMYIWTCVSYYDTVYGSKTSSNFVFCGDMLHNSFKWIQRLVSRLVFIPISNLVT